MRFTIPQLRQFVSVHLFVGMLLIGPVALKMASTGYRFLRYYTGNVAYRRKGPPELVLRLIGPIVVLSTVAVFAHCQRQKAKAARRGGGRGGQKVHSCELSAAPAIHRAKLTRLPWAGG